MEVCAFSRIASIQLNYLLCPQCRDQWTYRKPWKSMLWRLTPVRTQAVSSSTCSLLVWRQDLAESVGAEHTSGAADCSLAFAGNQNPLWAPGNLISAPRASAGPRLTTCIVTNFCPLLMSLVYLLFLVWLLVYLQCFRIWLLDLGLFMNLERTTEINRRGKTH